MGWLWTSSSTPPSPTGDDAPGDKTRQQTPVAPTPVHHSPPAATNQPPPSSSSPKDDDDVEVAKFLQEMMAEVKSVRASLDAASSSSSKSPHGDGDTARAAATLPPSSTTTAPATKSTWASRWAASSRMFSPPSSSSTPVETTTTPTQEENETPDSPEKQRLSPLAESLLPTEMNCEQAFNLAYYCQSLGGQFTALYRYGGLRSCSDNWDDFWFCMRVKGVAAGAAKEDMIRAHYRKKELAKYGPGKPSSEDVWRERRARVKPGEALSLPMDEPAQPMSDAELQKWEMEYYQSIRDQLKNGDNNNNA